MKKTTIYLDESSMAELKAIAQRESRSEASVIREGLAIYLAERKTGLPSFVGSVSDPTFSAADDEAYLEENWKPD